jgi:predicted enzyme related to lactoylglutathione lyase
LTSDRPPALASVILGSRTPDRAVAWYRSALGLAPVDAASLAVTRRNDVGPTAVEPMRIIPNFHVDDIAVVEARLVAMEAIWVREVEATSCGIIGTVLDPDGNYVQVIETPSRGFASLPQRRAGKRSRDD